MEKTKNRQIIELMQSFIIKSNEIVFNGDDQTIWPAIISGLNEMRNAADSTIKFVGDTEL